MEALLVGVLWILVYIAILALVVYVVIWVLTSVIGVPIPGKIIQILWVIVALVALILIVQLLLGGSPRIKIGDSSNPKALMVVAIATTA